MTIGRDTFAFNNRECFRKAAVASSQGVALRDCVWHRNCLQILVMTQAMKSLLLSCAGWLRARNIVFQPADIDSMPEGATNQLNYQIQSACAWSWRWRCDSAVLWEKLTHHAEVTNKAAGTATLRRIMPFWLPALCLHRLHSGDSVIRRG